MASNPERGRPSDGACTIFAPACMACILHALMLGNAMDRKVYDRNMQEMLDDDQTYRKLKEGSCLHIDERLAAVDEKEGKDSRQPVREAAKSAGRNPLLYSLPKVHKPMRPIVSLLPPCINCTSHVTPCWSIPISC